VSKRKLSERARSTEWTLVQPPNTTGMGVVVNLANWTNSNPPKLEAHEPELTESMVALETDGGS